VIAIAMKISARDILWLASTVSITVGIESEIKKSWQTMGPFVADLALLYVRP
jgi:hypothetical protein